MPAKKVTSKKPPASKSRAKPAAKRAAKPTAKRAAKPSPKPAATRGTPVKPKSVAKPATKPATKPVAKAKTSTPAANSPASRRSFLAQLDREMAGPKRPAKGTLHPRSLEKGPTYDFAVEASRLLRDDKCEDVVLLDVRGHSMVTDFVIIGSGTSERQMRSILQHVEDLGATRGFQAFRSNADDRASWVLVDFVDVVVHLFEPNTRAHYDLETLWPDAGRIQWERPDQLERDRAGLHV
jgi:ribosome-associated protein